MERKFVEVYFESVDCWKCGTKYSVYFIGNVLDENGCPLGLSSPVEFHHPIVVEKVQEYFTQHPELGIPLGVVKERYSNTVRDSYPSFGCPKCDAIFGDFYYKDLGLEACYEKSDENTILIDISEF